MKKITIFALNLSAGGIEKYISSLCKMLEKDYDIDIISTYKHDEKPKFEFSSKIKIQYLVNDNIYKISIKDLIKKHKYISCIKEIIRRRKIIFEARHKNIQQIKNINSDYVITTRTYHNNFVNKYLKDKKIIKIATEHNYHNNDKKYIKKFIKSVTNFNYVVHCTTDLYEFYKDKIKGPINVEIPNMIDINNKEKSKLNNKNLLSVGRLSPEKGYLDLIEIMKLINKKDKNIKLIICGEGQERNLIENKIKEYNLENYIELKGFVEEKQLEKEYINSTIYILPSISEAFGMVLLEAMHFGLPCIAFDSASGANYLLKNDTGIIIKNRNFNEMADKIIELFNNKSQLKKYQQKGLIKVQDFYINNIYKKWQKILKNGW